MHCKEDRTALCILPPCKLWHKPCRLLVLLVPDSVWPSLSDVLPSVWVACLVSAVICECRGNRQRSNRVYHDTLKRCMWVMATLSKVWMTLLALTVCVCCLFSFFFLNTACDLWDTVWVTGVSISWKRKRLVGWSQSETCAPCGTSLCWFPPATLAKCLCSNICLIYWWLITDQHPLWPAPCTLS